MDLRTLIRAGRTRLIDHTFLTWRRGYPACCVFEEQCGEVEFKNFLGDDTGAVEGVVKPEVGGEGVVRRGGGDAGFGGVAAFEAGDARRFDAASVVGGSVAGRGIRIDGSWSG